MLEAANSLDMEAGRTTELILGVLKAGHGLHPTIFEQESVDKTIGADFGGRVADDTPGGVPTSGAREMAGEVLCSRQQDGACEPSEVAELGISTFTVTSELRHFVAGAFIDGSKHCQLVVLEIGEDSVGVDLRGCIVQGTRRSHYYLIVITMF
jgi:hypothetical protein